MASTGQHPGDELLGIYLNDHLAGATAGIELVKRTLAENRGTSFEAVLKKLFDDITTDRETLQGLMREFGVPIRVWKSAVAWGAEKAARLKLNGKIRGYSPLSRLVELESLLLGVEGKASMWRTLLELSATDQRMDAERLRGLLARAQHQQTQLEKLRVEASKAAFNR